MKVCVVGTSISQTSGYAKVVYNMLKELRGHVELHHFATQTSSTNLRPALEDVITHEVEEFGFTKLKEYCEENSIDVVFLYQDIRTILEYLQHWKPPRCWVYLDTIGHGIDQSALKLLEDSVERIYLMNDYWKSVYPFKNSGVLEHGVDTNVYYKKSVPDLRKKINIPENAVVFLNCNRNARRKRLDLTIQAFVLFCKRNPSSTAHLLLLTSKDGFYNIGSILYAEIRRHKFDCSARVRTIFTDKLLLKDEDVNDFYNIADYGLNTSYGEGYGLTVLEHLAVGKPQVLTGLPSYTFVGNNAILVPPSGEREYDYKDDILLGYFEHWKVEDIAVAMEQIQGRKTQFSPKSWKDVMVGLVTDLQVPLVKPPQTEQIVEIPMLMG